MQLFWLYTTYGFQAHQRYMPIYAVTPGQDRRVLASRLNSWAAKENPFLSKLLLPFKVGTHLGKILSLSLRCTHTHTDWAHTFLKLLYHFGSNLVLFFKYIGIYLTITFPIWLWQWYIFNLDNWKCRRNNEMYPLHIYHFPFYLPLPPFHHLFTSSKSKQN